MSFQTIQDVVDRAKEIFWATPFYREGDGYVPQSGTTASVTALDELEDLNEALSLLREALNGDESDLVSPNSEGDTWVACIRYALIPVVDTAVNKDESIAAEASGRNNIR